MRALLYKEYRQYHLLPMGGLLISVALIVLSVLWVKGYATTAQDQTDLEGICSFLVLLASGVLLMVPAAGAVSSETAGGALTYLLGLPVSRTRIWLAKVVAGLGLAAVAAVLLAVPISIVMPGVPEQGHFLLYFPDAVAWGLGVYAVTLFHSTLLSRTLTVLIVAPVTVLALIGGVALAAARGVTPLQYDSGLSDVSLWSLVLALPFLLASWVAFSRGELLDSGRKWLLAVPTLVIGLALVVLLMSGAALRQQRYVRSQVRAVDGVTGIARNDVVPLYVSGNQAPFRRDETHGWSRREGTFRSHSTVLLDLKTGRDVASWSGQREVGLSPDGKYAFLAAPENPRAPGPGSWDIYDVARGRSIYRGALAIDPVGSVAYGIIHSSGATWSPTGRWLALPWTHGDAEQRGDRPTTIWKTLVLMHPDGSGERHLDLAVLHPPEKPGRPLRFEGEVLSAWTWAPDGDHLLLLSKAGELSRYSPVDASRRTLWHWPRNPFEKEWMVQRHRLSLSPDGQRLAIFSPVREPDQQQAGSSHVWILRAGGEKVEPVADFSTDNVPEEPLRWSPDSRTLYVGTRLSWRADRGAVPLRLPRGADLASAEILPLEEGLVLSGGRGRLHHLVSSTQGPRLLESVFPNLAQGGSFRGVDTEGRLLLLKPEIPAELLLLDPQTGAAKRVYP